MFKFLKKKRLKVIITLKSGKEIIFKCDKIKVGTKGGKLNSYDIEGLKEKFCLYIDIESIATIFYIHVH